MKYFELFSGVGGFSIGIQNAYENNISGVGGESQERNGETITSKPSPQTTPESIQRQRHQSRNFSPGDAGQIQCVGFSEIDKYASQVLKYHHPEIKNWGDITKIDWKEVPDFDLLTGGVPCQSWSIAGKRGGFDDVRGTMWWEFVRCLKEKQPKVFIAENVKGLLSHDGGESFKKILRELSAAGYALDWEVVNAKNFGVPQNRERVFIIGKRLDTLKPEEII